MKRIAAVVAFAILLALLASISPLSVRSQGMPPTLVETATVTSMEFHDQVTLVGRTEALSNSSIVAEVAGRVLRIDAPEGNAVRRGEPLVTIDPERIRLSLDAKRAQVKQAQATAQLAEKELARSTDLRERDLVSAGGYDAAVAEYARAQGLHDQYVAEMKQLELDLEKCAIRSPFDGYTVRKLVDVGEGVAAGTPVYEVVDLSTVKVIVDLPERHFGAVDKGSKALIRVSGDGDDVVTGIVTGIGRSASEVTHTFPVIIAVNNRDGRLGSGMLVRTQLSLSHVFSSLAVSKDAIVRQGNQTMVYTINDGKAAPVPVVTGSTEGEMISVSGEGITEGMVVIVRGNERVFPGSPVRTNDQSGAAQQPAAGQSASGPGAGDGNDGGSDETADADKGSEG